jgi:diacylglycerol kinase (ATP)
VGIRAALAVNPTSGHGRAGRVADAVADRLRGAVDHLTTVAASSVEESRDLMVRARDAGLDLLVVLGGDGSAHQGVQFCAGTDVALAVLPGGTGNDLATALGMPEDPLAAADEVAAAIRDDRSRRIDLGRVTDGPWFATVLCAGFDSAVNERANRMRWPHGPRRYDLAILAELAALRPAPLTVEQDGDHAELTATMIAVGNTPSYGGGIPVCPAATVDDGRFDVTLVGQTTRRHLVRMLPGLRTGRHVTDSAVHTSHARELRIGGNDDWVVYADGERIGPLPVEVTCVPEALTVVGSPT